MAETCVNIGCPEVIRLALQDQCTGRPIAGAGNGMVMRCLRNVTIEARVRDAETSEFVSDCGQVDEDIQDSYTQGYNVSFESSRISPELQALLLGYDLLQIDGDNVGFIEEAAAGCTSQQARPTFFVEAFYRVRQCDSSGGANYLRRIIPGVKFNPVENDREGSIGYERFTGTSRPMLTQGYLNDQAVGDAGVADNGGPFQDMPADIVTDLEAMVDANPDHLNVGIRFVDPLVSPTNGLTLVAGTCYSAEVPADA